MIGHLSIQLIGSFICIFVGGTLLQLVLPNYKSTDYKFFKAICKHPYITCAICDGLALVATFLIHGRI